MRRRDYDDDLDQPKRSSPYQDLQEQDEDDYDQDYDDYEDDDMVDEPTGRKSSVRKGSTLSVSTRVKMLGVVIALLVVVLIVLVIVRFAIGGGKDAAVSPTEAPVATDAPQAEQTTAPSSIVFAPIPQATDVPQGDTGYTDEPYVDNSGYDEWSYGDDAYGDTGYGDTATDEPIDETPKPDALNEVVPVIATATPTAEPQPTDTPLPIILTNTPTPTPEPTATPTPSPTPEPTATPTPSPTPVANIATGTVNRDANLRANAVSNAKVKKTIKKGESVTIHETTLDSTGKVWYYLTVDDTNDEGWMRDYVVTVADELAAPTATPKAETSEAADSTESSSSGNDEIIATGKTNREANLRKVMNGKVITQLKKNKTVEIYEVLKDKKGNTWYRVKPQGSNTEGYIRDYVITLDSSVSVDTSSEAQPSAAADSTSLLDRDVIGHAVTNRAANIREKPLSNASIVRQLGNGTKLRILAKYAGVKEETWYEVVTESGKTYGFVRDYVINVTSIEKDVPVLTYE